MIRALQQDDLEKLKEIHEKYYKNEFDYIDFYDKFLCAFVVVEDNHIIIAGGLRTILESVIITDKNASTRRKREALIEMLLASKHFAEKYDYHELHAFVQDPDWEKHLIKKVGFVPTKGHSLVLSL